MKSLDDNEYLKKMELLDDTWNDYKVKYPNATNIFNFILYFKQDGLLELFEKAKGREIILRYGTVNGRLVDHIVYYGFYDHETGEMEWINPPPDNER